MHKPIRMDKPIVFADVVHYTSKMLHFFFEFKCQTRNVRPNLFMIITHCSGGLCNSKVESAAHPPFFSGQEVRTTFATRLPYKAQNSCTL